MKSSKTCPFFVFPWHVLLLPLIFPLLPYANNLGEVVLDSLRRPILFSFLFGMVVFVLSWLLTRNLQKAGLIFAASNLIVFSYGHIYALLKNVKIFGILIGRHRYLLALSFLLLAFVIWRVIKLKRPPKQLTLLVNLLVIPLFLFQLIRVASFEINVHLHNKDSSKIIQENSDSTYDENARDIYLIVLDGYSRSDWLYERSGYDNSKFLSELEDMGFYIVPCSRSNYAYTIQSMTSELNMNYLQNLDVDFNDVEMSQKLKYSEVRTTLSNMSYEFIFYETGYPWIEMKDADRYIKADEDISPIDEFEVLYLSTTILKYPLDVHIANTENDNDPVLLRHAARVWTVFESLKNPLNQERPVFVYAHILSPHSPRCFNKNGTINYLWQGDPESTHSTFDYIHNEIIEAISVIISNSDPDPIIILQSDHGDGDGAYKNLNLNAYYLPDGGEDYLYPTITPVNTFRIIFNHYFDFGLPLLEDRIYFSLNEDRYDFELIEDPYDYCREMSEEIN